MIYTYINNNSIKKNMITIIILHPIFGSTGMTRLIKKTNPSLPSPINGKK
jgi:hypothetical protein